MINIGGPGSSQIKERKCRGGCGRIAAAAVKRKNSVKPVFKAVGEGEAGVKFWEVAGQTGEDHGHGGLAREGGLTGGDFPGNASEGVEVGPGAELSPGAPGLFGGDVEGGTTGGVGLVEIGSDAGDAEVGQLIAAEAIAALQDVFRLQIEVDSMPGMGMGEGVENLEEKVFQGEIVGKLVGLEFAAVDKFHHQIESPGRKGLIIGLNHSEIENLNDAGMLEHGKGTGLPDKELSTALISLLQNSFDGDQTIAATMASPIGGTHSALTEDRFDLKMTKE